MFHAIRCSLALTISLFILNGLLCPGAFATHTAAGPGTASDSLAPDEQQRRKVLFVNSYHWGYEWSDGITRSICEVLGAKVNSDGEIDNEKSKVFLKVVYMDTKRKTSEEYLKETGEKLKKLIDQWQPDVVITSDDNAAKYLIVPFYRDSPVPFVFCGINWDSSDYGLPCSNVTGMIEVQLIDQLLELMRSYAKGDRIAFLKGDDQSARKEALQYEKHFHITLDKRFVTTFIQWKEQYADLQKSADMLLLGNSASIDGWNSDEARAIVADQTRIPTGNWDAWMAPLALITFATKPEEQGKWAAEAALSILGGTSPAAIPVVRNKTANVYLNMRLARKLGVKFPMEVMHRASFTSE